ncbi:PAS domain-containing sensor histidine kinase [Alteromonas sp. CYL-A6]|uniref:PAS domain-containing sensor histidine kinase n=1 Tax=Alteromonas nitratireducens TaxID=3390813 RepID=UPI0034B80A36
MTTASSMYSDNNNSRVAGTSSLLVLSLDDRLTITAANTSWLSQTGWAARQLVGMPIDKLVAEPDRERVTHLLKTVIKNGDTARFSFECQREDGGLTALQCTATPVENSGAGHVSLVIVPFKTVGHLVEKSAEEIELFGKAAQIAKFGYWSIDLNTLDLFWSKEIYAIHGLSEEEYTPTLETAINFYHPEDRDEVKKMVEAGIRENRSWQFQLRLVRPSGEVRVVRCRAEVDEEPATGSPRIYGICQDVTDYEDLSEQVNLLSKVAEVSITGVTICDSEKRVMWVNRTFEDITGYTLDEVRGKRLGQVLQGEDTNPDTASQIREALNREAEVDVEILNYRKNGKAYWNHLLISPVKRNGILTHFIAIQHDITEQKLQQETMARRMKMQAIGQIAGKVCHDINNIMAIVSGNTQLLRLQSHSEKAEKCIKNIETATDRASTLTRKLVTLVRERHHRHERVVVDELLSHQLRTLKTTLPESVTLNCWRSAQCTVITDKVVLMDAITSLVANATDAIAEHGTITVNSACCSQVDTQRGVVIVEPRPSSHYALITVADNGEGIAESDLKRIFEPFYTTRDKRAGGGLGLSVLYEYCLHEGVGLQVDSHPGDGATFSLWLPCEKEEK